MTASRLSQARKGVRPSLKGRMMLSGPAGSGKTRSGLIIATVLAEGQPILGIDTEKESMLTYADDFDFTHLAWAPPYDPRELVEVLDEAGRSFGVVVVDSLSHFWRKEGGVLDIANGKFTGWKEARPVQEDLVEAILNCGAHVILGVRSKVEHTQETENGKQVVKKIGMAAQQDDDLEFEMNVAIEMSMDHTATIAKSRTTVLPTGRAFKGGQIAEMARIYGEWLGGGEPPASTGVAAGLLARMNKLDPVARVACKNEFAARFGRPEQLRSSQEAEAEALVAGFEAQSPPAEAPVAAEAENTPDEVPQPPPPDPEKEAKKTARRVYSEAQKLHIFGTKDCGLCEDDIDCLVMVETNGRTTSTKDLSDAEQGRLRNRMEYVRDGHISMADMYDAVDEFHATSVPAS